MSVECPLRKDAIRFLNSPSFGIGVMRMENTTAPPTKRPDMRPATRLAMFATLILTSTIFSLTAVGQSISVAAVGPARVDFGHQASSTKSEPRAVILTNAGSDPLPVSQIVLEGDFAATHECPKVLAAGQHCRILVSFKPVEEGVRTGQLTIAHEAGTQRVVLSGTGMRKLDASPK
jgi:hypothetical protein